MRDQGAPEHERRAAVDGTVSADQLSPETPLKVGGADGRAGRGRGTWSQGGGLSRPSSSGSSDRLGGSAAQGWGVWEGLAAFMHQADVRLWGPLFQGQPESGEIPPQNGTILRKIKSRM